MCVNVVFLRHPIYTRRCNGPDGLVSLASKPSKRELCYRLRSWFAPWPSRMQLGHFSADRASDFSSVKDAVRIQDIRSTD